MTELAPADATVPPPGPSPLALLIAYDLVTRYRMRLADNRDSRLSGLQHTYELAAATWTGPRAALVAFYEPPSDPAVAGVDLAARCDAARRWGHDRLQQQGASKCDILLVALHPVSGSIMASSAGEPVRIGAAWVDAALGNAGVVLPIPNGLPPVADLRARARHVREGRPVPTLAAVDLAERQAVAGGYAAPVRRATITQPVVTYSLIGVFVAIYLLEQLLLRRFAGNPGGELIAFGALGNAPPFEDWWRFISSAFIHDNTSFFHILFNGLAMLWIGRLVEQFYGRLVLVGTFVITAVVGGLVWILATAVGIEAAGGITIGASGGISGLIGLLLVMGRVQGKSVPAGVATGVRNYAVIVIALNVVLGFLTSGVNNFAHLGGVVAGALVGLVIPPLQRIGGRDLTLAEKSVLVAAIVVAAVAVILAAQYLITTLTGTGAQFIGQ